MEYLDNKTSWESVFTEELEALTEKMSTFDIESLSKSKLRLSLESKLLDWKKYEAWAQETYGCASVKDSVSEATLKSYSVSAQQAHALYSNFKFWNQDLVPVFIWENQLIVFGLQYNPHLQKIPNHIFVLAPPKVLNYLANILSLNKTFGTDMDSFNDLFGESSEESLEGISSETQTVAIDFKDLGSDAVASLVSRPRHKPGFKQPETEVWDLISDRKEEYFFESKKQFDAFLILRINFDVTQLYLLDPELEKQNVNDKLFEYSLNLPNNFKQVFETGESSVVEAAAVGLDPLNYKYICIAPLKRSRQVVGFFLGLKNTKPAGQDINLLEDLAQETARAS